MKINYLFTMALLTASFAVLAQPEHRKDHVHNHKAHVHGVAELTLAMEGNTLEIGFDSPSFNILGFEHKANTPDQRKLVTQAEEALKQPSRLLVFSGTRCEIQHVTVDMTGVMHKKDHHGHSNHEHHDHRDKNHHKEHANHAEHNDTHSEITANYRFSCEDGAKLSSISLSLFDQFPSIEKINAMWVTIFQQGSKTLTASENSIYFQ